MDTNRATNDALAIDADQHPTGVAPAPKRIGHRFAKGHKLTTELDQLKDFAKQVGGMNSVAKHIIEKGSTAVTEHQFTQMLMEHARVNKIAGESDATAFSRIFSAPESINIRKAHAITRNAGGPVYPYPVRA